MNILITGYNGLIGSNFLMENHQNFQFGFIGRSEPKFNGEFIRYDFNSCEGIKIPKNKYDTIIHLAGQPSVWFSKKNIIRDCQTNLIGTLRLIELADLIDVKKMIIFSTGDIYGKRKTPNENSVKNLLNPYSISKSSVENYVSYFRKVTKKKIYIVRPSMVVGPGLRRNPFYDIVSGFVHGYIDLFVSSKSRFDFIHTHDINEALIKLVKGKYPFNDINLCSGDLVSLESIIDYLKEKLSLDPPINYVNNDSKIIITKGMKSIRKIEWQPQIDIINYSLKLFQELQNE